MADWKSFSVEIPGKELVEPISDMLETLLVYLDTLKTYLETVKAYLQDYGNPISSLVESLIKLIEEAVMSLKTSGLYGYFDIPQPNLDPGLRTNSGGYSAFINRFKASLLDTKDPNRPQPRSSSTGGFVLLVADFPNLEDMIRNTRRLMGLFGKKLETPRMEPPQNFKVQPIDRGGDPILAVAAAFAGPIEAVQLSWTLPSTKSSPDKGFLDAASAFSNEVIPPHFLIMRSEIDPASSHIELAQMGDADAVGAVTFDMPVPVDQTLGGRFAKVEDDKVMRQEVLKDDSGEPFIKFQRYWTPGVGGEITGQLGRYRYIDDTVESGKTYFYRVCAYTGNLQLDGTSLANMPTKTDQLTTGVGGNQSRPYFSWPGDEVAMGKPTGIVRITMPEPAASDFDVLENVRKVFKTAFSLDFHLEMPPGAEFNGDGTPTDDTPNSWVGRGLLLDQAGTLAQFQSVDVINKVAQYESVHASMNDPNSLTPLQLPWLSHNLRRQCARLTDDVVSSMMQHPEAVKTFQDMMRGSLPRGPITTKKNLQGKSTLEQIVGALIEDPADEQSVLTYVDSYSDVGLRLNIASVVTFFKSFTLGGDGVDWIAIQPLRDIIPWSGQYLYDILDKIQALESAYQGASKEMEAYIDLIERKITALETFIEFLLEILGFIENLQFSINMLAAGGISGDVFQWIQTIDTAGGTPPASGAGGYTAGVCFAYSAPDVAAFAAAFALIFGA